MPINPWNHKTILSLYGAQLALSHCFVHGGFHAANRSLAGAPPSINCTFVLPFVKKKKKKKKPQPHYLFSKARVDEFFSHFVGSFVRWFVGNTIWFSVFWDLHVGGFVYSLIIVTTSSKVGRKRLCNSFSLSLWTGAPIIYQPMTSLA